MPVPVTTTLLFIISHFFTINKVTKIGEFCGAFEIYSKISNFAMLKPTNKDEKS